MKLEFNYKQEGGHWYASTDYKSGYFVNIGDTKEEAKEKLIAEMRKILGPTDTEVVEI